MTWHREYAFTPEHVKRNNKIISAHKKGESDTSIGRRFGLSRSRIGVILRKARILGLLINKEQ